MLTFSTPKHHWNYFLAIEKDLETVSRFIEFENANMQTYSIELAHILISASSEVDVVMKLLCGLVSPGQRAENIEHYKGIINANCPGLITEEIAIHRHGITHQPWINWQNNLTPLWWRSYNNVKHERNSHYNEANLQNAINALGALLIATIYYYKKAAAAQTGGIEPSFQEITAALAPSSFLAINNSDYYQSFLIL